MEGSEGLPEGDAEGQCSQKDEVQQQQRRGEEPVDVAGIVDIAQVAIWLRCQSRAAVRRLRIQNMGSEGHAEIRDLLDLSYTAAGATMLSRL